MNSRSFARASKAKLRDRFKEVVRETVLQAAEEVFSRDGLQAAKMEAIAERAGVAVGTLYNHFHDRDALLSKLREERDREIIDKMDEALQSSQGRPFAEQLSIFLRALYEHFELHRRFLVISMQQEFQWMRPSHMATCAKPSHTMRELYDRIGTLVDVGVKEGALNADAAEFSKSFLMGSVRAMLIREFIFDAPQTTLEDRVARTADFFLRGASVR